MDEFDEMLKSLTGAAGAPLASLGLAAGTGALGLTIAGRGKNPMKRDPWEFVRELGDEDLEELTSPAPAGRDPSPLKRLKTSHHNIARLAAEGRRDVEISLITGTSQNRLSLLRRDPAFQELLDYYTAQKEDKFLDVQERLANYALDAVEELHERLEEGKLSTRELMDSLEMTLDRGLAPVKGAGKVTPGGGSGLQVNINFVKANGQGEEFAGITIEGEEG